MADQSLSIVGFAGASSTGVVVSPPAAVAGVADPATTQGRRASQTSETAAPGGAAALSNGVVAAGVSANGSKPGGAAKATYGAMANALSTDGNPVDAAVKKANQSLSASGTQLVFVFDDRSHCSVVKLLDIQTQKVVQEIPSGAMPETANALSGDSSSGALIDTKA